MGVVSTEADLGTVSDLDTASDLGAASDLDTGAASDFMAAIRTFMAGMGMAAVRITTAPTDVIEQHVALNHVPLGSFQAAAGCLKNAGPNEGKAANGGTMRDSKWITIAIFNALIFSIVGPLLFTALATVK
jgi:hypothetical protein